MQVARIAVRSTWMALALAACHEVHGREGRSPVESARAAPVDRTPLPTPPAPTMPGSVRPVLDLFTERVGLAAYGPLRTPGRPDAPELAAGKLAVVSLACSIDTRLPEPMPAANGTCDFATVDDRARISCIAAPMPRSEWTQRLGTCLRLEPTAPDAATVAAVIGALKRGERIETQGRLVFVHTTTLWREPATIRSIRVGCEGVTHPCDPVGIRCVAEGPLRERSGSSLVVHGPLQDGEPIFAPVPMPEAFVVLRDPDANEPSWLAGRSFHDASHARDSVARLAGADLEGERPDVVTAVLLDRVWLTFAAGDRAAALAALAELRGRVAATPPTNGALVRAIASALPIFEKLENETYSLADPCTKRRP